MELYVHTVLESRNGLKSPGSRVENVTAKTIASFKLSGCMCGDMMFNSGLSQSVCPAQTSTSHVPRARSHIYQ
jgi:hypothetical protein